MRVPIELSSRQEIDEFVDIVRGVDMDVRLVGKDENGNSWNISAKSLLCSLIVTAGRKERTDSDVLNPQAHEVDWNTLYCECEKDIYTLIKKFVVGSEMNNG